MLTRKELLEVADGFKLMPEPSFVALRRFMGDVTEAAVDAATGLAQDEAKRGALCGYARGLRDALERFEELRSGAYRDWPEFRAVPASEHDAAPGGQEGGDDD